MSLRTAGLLLVSFVFLAEVRAFQVLLPPGQTTLTSLSSSGVAGNGDSIRAAISSDGRYVLFESQATNLVSGDDNGKSDVFVHDRETGTTTRVSVSTTGVAGNGSSTLASISGDGRYAMFTSVATNLTPGDRNSGSDVFAHDMQTGVTELVSITPGGTAGDSDSYSPVSSHDGRYVAFMSRATDLVPGNDDLNDSLDIFVRDRIAGTTSRLSNAMGGGSGNGSSNGPAISGDGRFICFSSAASNLVAGDFNGQADIFLHDTLLGTTELMSSASDGTLGNGASLAPSLTDDGRYVAFYTSASNLIPGDGNGVADAFIKDRVTGGIELVSVSMTGQPGNKASDVTKLSADGRFVCFGSAANDLVPDDTGPLEHKEEHDIFIRDRGLGTTTRISVSSSGEQGDLGSIRASMTPDATLIAFQTYASNLYPGDTNGKTDVVVHDRNPWTDIGGGLAGSAGIPQLAGSGLLIGGTSGQLTLTSAKPLSPAYLFISFQSMPVPFMGGEIISVPNRIMQRVTAVDGSVAMPFLFPSGVQAGIEFWFQFLILDDAAPFGVAISTGTVAVSP